MRILFTLLIALLSAVALGWLLQQSPGGVVFTYREWVIQTSLVVFVLTAIVVFLLAYALLRALRKLLRARADFRRWSEFRRRRRSESCLNQGLLAMMEGDWRRAEQAFRKGAACSQAPLANYLGAAQAAYRLGEIERCERYLSLARRHDETGGPAAGLTQARLQIDQQQIEQANDTLGALEQRHEQVTLLSLETALTMQDWNRATGLLQECSRRGLLTAEQVRAGRLTLYTGLLREAGDKQDRAALEEVWRGVPARLKKNNALIGAYVSARLRHDSGVDCEAMLRRALKKQWDPELARLFGLVEARNPRSQLEFAEGWLERFPQDADLLLTLGRLCKKNRLWGKAASYLEQSIQARPDPAACQELAALLEQQGDHAAAGTYFQQGLNLLTSGKRPDPPGTALTLYSG